MTDLFGKKYYHCSVCGKLFGGKGRTGKCSSCLAKKENSGKKCSICDVGIGRSSFFGICQKCKKNKKAKSMKPKVNHDHDFKRFILAQLMTMYETSLKKFQEQYDEQISLNPINPGTNKEKIRIIQRDMERLRLAQQELKKMIEGNGKEV